MLWPDQMQPPRHKQMLLIQTREIAVDLAGPQEGTLAEGTYLACVMTAQVYLCTIDPSRSDVASVVQIDAKIKSLVSGCMMVAAVANCIKVVAVKNYCCISVASLCMQRWVWPLWPSIILDSTCRTALQFVMVCQCASMLPHGCR